MRLPALAIRNHQFTIVIVLMFTLFGVVSFLTMPRSEDPMTQFAAAAVVAVYPGVNPTDLEQLVADPIEEVVNELEDLTEVNTSIEDGLVTVFVRFVSGSDPDDKYGEVQDAVNSITDELPEGIVLLETLKQDITSVSILQLALVSESASYRQLQREAERLERLLERVPGVRRASSWAFPDQEVEVSVDMERLHATGFSVGRVIQAIQSQSANIPGGQIETTRQRFNVKTSGEFESIDDIRRTVVGAQQGRIVYVDDIADVSFGYADASYLARFNSQQAVFLTVIQRSNTNIFAVKSGIDALLDAQAGRLPADMRLEVVFDQGESVRYRVNSFFVNLLQGLFLVGLVVLLALGRRASLIVIIAIPISIFIAIGWLDLSGYALQQMSIVGLVIALGLLVDNAIVVTENISRFLGQGFSRTEAATKGTSQIAWAITSSTITTMLAFLPMLLLMTETGDFIRSMPVTVVLALAASLLISLALTPYLSSRLLPEPTQARKQEGLLKGPLNRIVSGPYGKTLQYAVSHPARVLIVSVLVFGISIGVFPLVGISLFPKAEKTQFIVDIDTPVGSNLAWTDQMARRVEDILKEEARVVGFATNIGRGNPRIYYNVAPKREAPTHAEILVDMGIRDDNARAQLISDLRTRVSTIPGARIELREFEQGPPVEAPIAIKIFGENLDLLARLADSLQSVVQGTVGTINVNKSSGHTKTDLELNINRDKAGIFGVPMVEIDRTVRVGIAGLPIATLRDDAGQDYSVQLRLPIDDHASVSDLERISVSSIAGAQIPLQQLASLQFRSGPNRIEHYMFERAVTVTSDVLDGYNVAAVTADITEQLKNHPLPSGNRYYIGGEEESREESFGGMGKALILALLGIFAVLVLQFHSIKQPLIVFVAIPFAITGAIFALLITGNSFSFTAFVGLTSLVGIVVNNSIILVDYANQLVQSGMTPSEAIVEAGKTRFIPIILTTLTTIGALLPLTIGASKLWAPFGWTIIGGLIVSTLLTLLVVPVLYKMFSGDERLMVGA